MTITELLKNATLQEKLDFMNEIIADLKKTGTYLIDGDNKDSSISDIYYNREEDEVFCNYENLPSDYIERKEELAEAV